MKGINLITMLSILILSCKNNPVSKLDLAEKRIRQKIEVAGMGIVKEYNIDSLTQINDSTFYARHHFKNKLVDKNIRVARKYFFDKNLDSIKKHEDVKTEMESKGEWIKF